jgi:nitroreductase/NAD-dependent dihydropyrimidine dehydrogenase PreA subunit
MDQPLVEIDPKTCTACDLCVLDCPPQLFVHKEDEPPGFVSELSSECIACGHCAAICPSGALTHGALETDGFAPRQSLPEPQQVLHWLRSRRSIRKFKQQDAVERSEIERLIEAARYAPSGHNVQSPHYIVLLNREKVARLGRSIIEFYRTLFNRLQKPLTRQLVKLVAGRRKTKLLVESIPAMIRTEERIERGEDPLFWDAPALIVIHADTAEETGEVDCAIAADHITLMAPSLGLGTCYIGYASAALKHERSLSRELGIPNTHRAYVVLVLGHPAIKYKRVPPRPAPKIEYR